MPTETPVQEKPKTETAPPPKTETVPVKEAAPAQGEKAAWMTPPAKEEKKDPPTAGEKPKTETTSPKAGAPKGIELKAPEGVTLEPAMLTKFAAEMQALGLSQDQAQKLLERDLGADKARVQANTDFMKAKDQQWLGEVKSTWGTAKFAENSEHAKRGFDFLDPDGTMRKDMEQAGLAHWPKMVFAAERLGRALGEDKVGLRTETTRSVEKVSPEQALKKQYQNGGKK